jgi:pantothenate kinase
MEAAARAAGGKVRDVDLVYKTIAVAKHHKPWLVVNVGSGVSMLKLDEQVPQKEP